MSQSEDRCLFCRIVQGEIPAKKVFEDDDVVAFEDIDPKAPTHLLVIPRTHIATIADLSHADSTTIGRVITAAGAIARERGLHEEGFRLVVNNGEGAGQTVFHIHVHLLGGRPFTWPPG